MKTIFNIILILIIQTMILEGSAGIAGGEVSPGDDLSGNCLSPKLVINSVQLTDSLLREMVLIGLKENNGYVPDASKMMRISPVDIYRLTTQKERDEIKEEADKKRRPHAIEVLKKAGGNETKAARILGINRNTLRKLIPKKDREEIRKNIRQDKKEQLMQLVTKYCDEDGWLKKVGAVLGLTETGARDRMIREGISYTEIKKSPEVQARRRKIILQALKEAGGNYNKAAEALGMSRNTLQNEFKKEAAKFREEVNLEKEDRKIISLFETLEETRHDRKLTAQKLGITRKTLNRWMEKYKNLDYADVILIKLKNFNEILFDIRKKALSVDQSDEKAARFFYRASHFKLRRYTELIEVIVDKVAPIHHFSNLKRMVNICNEVKDDLEQIFFVNKEEQHDKTEDVLNEIISIINSHEEELEQITAQPDILELKSFAELKKETHALLGNLKFVEQAI